MKLERWSLDFYRLPYSKEVRWSNAIEREGVFALLELVAKHVIPRPHADVEKLLPGS